MYTGYSIYCLWIHGSFFSFSIGSSGFISFVCATYQSIEFLQAFKQQFNWLYNIATAVKLAMSKILKRDSLLKPSNISPSIEAYPCSISPYCSAFISRFSMIMMYVFVCSLLGSYIRNNKHNRSRYVLTFFSAIGQRTETPFYHDVKHHCCNNLTVLLFLIV